MKRPDSQGYLGSRVPVSLSSEDPVSIEQLINALDDGTWETLKDVGFEQGDFLPLYTFNPNTQRTVSFTDTTYARLPDFSLLTCIWNNLFPAGVTTHVHGEIRVASIGVDETVSLRIRNGMDNETVGELTGITTTGMKTIDADYEPATLDSRIYMEWQWKEDNGANASDVYDAFISLGAVV